MSNDNVIKAFKTEDEKTAEDLLQLWKEGRLIMIKMHEEGTDYFTSPDLSAQDTYLLTKATLQAMEQQAVEELFTNQYAPKEVH